MDLDLFKNAIYIYIYIYIYMYIHIIYKSIYLSIHRQWLLVIRRFSITNLINKKCNLTVTILEINNILVLDRVRINFCHIFLVCPDIFENSLEFVYWCNFEFPLAISSLSKVLKLWLENVPLSGYIELYQEILKI